MSEDRKTRWHKASQQFLFRNDPLIVEQDRIAAEAKAEKIRIASQHILDLCRASEKYQAEQQAIQFAWEERTQHG